MMEKIRNVKAFAKYQLEDTKKLEGYHYDRGA